MEGNGGSLKMGAGLFVLVHLCGMQLILGSSAHTVLDLSEVDACHDNVCLPAALRILIDLFCLFCGGGISQYLVRKWPLSLI